MSFKAMLVLCCVIVTQKNSGVYIDITGYRPVNNCLRLNIFLEEKKSIQHFLHLIFGYEIIITSSLKHVQFDIDISFVNTYFLDCEKTEKISSFCPIQIYI